MLQLLHSSSLRFTSCDELVDAITFTNIALLTAGAAGFIGTIAYYQSTLASSDISAATTIYVLYVLAALFLPRFFVKCGGVKRQLVIAIASLAFGIAAIDFGRAIAFARAVAFACHQILNRLDFSPLIYIAVAIGAVIAGQVIVWAYAQANVYTALIATAIGLVADGIALQVIFFVNALNDGLLLTNTALIGVPWLFFTLAIVGLLLFLEFKSLCIPEHCRFLIGLLIPVLGIAVFGKVAGASAALGTAFNAWFSAHSVLLARLHVQLQIDLGEFHHSLGRIHHLLAVIQVHLLSRLPSLQHRIHRSRLCHQSIRNP